MMDKFVKWYDEHYREISWFAIGWLSVCGLDDLARDDVSGAFVCFALAAINYILYRKN